MIAIESLLDRFRILMGLEMNYMPEEYVGDMFHYTSPAGFDSILFKNSEKVTLWASRFDCLNDFSEGTVAKTVFDEVCKDLKNNHEITEEIYNLIANVQPARTILFPKIVGDKFKGSRLESDRFVCSFSQNTDSLSMWNYYSKGNKYEGYNIGLRSTQVKESLENDWLDKDIIFHIYPVVYKKAEQEKMIRRLVLKLQELYVKGQETSVRYIVSNWLSEWGLIFKNEYFQHEEEVRIIIDVAKKTKDGVLQKRPIEIKYRNSYGYVIPYIELKLNKCALKTVCFGPLQCDDRQKEVQVNILNEMLAEKGYTLTETLYSRIPVRF